MIIKTHIFFCLISLCFCHGFAQNYEIKPADIKTGYSDFAPCMWKGQIVFTSNKPVNGNKSGFSNIFKVVDDQLVIFDETLKTNYHDGPISFAKEGKMACFSSNISSENESKRLPVGLFFSTHTDSGWTPAVPFEFNDPKFSNAYPSLSADGKTLYFSSTRPGGLGGTDIYVSTKMENGNWSTPENLGEAINTSQNESFPFYHESGRLFFSSNAGSQFGGLDIFYSDFKDNKWSFPKILPSPINSSADDFGIYMDINQKTGLLSSSRKKGRDMIYAFELNEPKNQLISKQENLAFETKCVTFFENNPNKDPLTPHMSYSWEIDGAVHEGKEVEHCFELPGTYPVKLNVYDSLLRTQEQVATYDYAVRTEEKPIIEVVRADSSKKTTVLRLVDLNLTNFKEVIVMWRINDKWYLGNEITIEEAMQNSSLLLIQSNEDHDKYRCYKADFNQWIH